MHKESIKVHLSVLYLIPASQYEVVLISTLDVNVDLLTVSSSYRDIPHRLPLTPCGALCRTFHSIVRRFHGERLAARNSRIKVNFARVNP